MPRFRLPFAPLRLAFAVGVGAFFWSFVAGFVYLIALHGSLPLRTDPLTEARQRAQRGDIDGAVRQYRMVVRIEPTDLGAACELGELLLRAGRPAEALTAFGEALYVRLDPRALVGVGDALKARGDAARAAHAYAEALRLVPDSPLVRQRLASAQGQ